VWRRRLAHASLLGLALLSAVVLGESSSPAWADCAQNERIAGECSSVITTNDGSEVSVELSTSRGGTSGSVDSGTEAGGGSGWWSPPPIRMEAELGSAECEVIVAGLCRAQAPPKQTQTASDTNNPPTPPTHASQLKGFRPQAPSLVIQPNAWSLPTLPVNLYASATRHRVSGELLGWPVVVRFTPVAYHWSYGDGSGQSFTNPGEPVAVQFSPTPTSHRYRSPGRYTVSLRVDYRAEFRFEGGSFDDIDGLVSARAADKTIEVLTVSPLLHGR
jgi:hypothetical protein